MSQLQQDNADANVPHAVSVDNKSISDISRRKVLPPIHGPTAKNISPSTTPTPETTSHHVHNESVPENKDATNYPPKDEGTVVKQKDTEDKLNPNSSLNPESNNSEQPQKRRVSFSERPPSRRSQLTPPNNTSTDLLPPATGHQAFGEEEPDKIGAKKERFSKLKKISKFLPSYDSTFLVLDKVKIFIVIFWIIAVGATVYWAPQTLSATSNSFSPPAGSYSAKANEKQAEVFQTDPSDDTDVLAVMIEREASSGTVLEGDVAYNATWYVVDNLLGKYGV